MHLIVVCSNDAAHLFTYDQEECSQEELGVVTMQRRKDGVRRDYAQLALDVGQSVSENASSEWPTTLATTSTYSNSERQLIADALRHVGSIVCVRCTVGMGGQQGLNDVLREHLSTTEHRSTTPHMDSADSPPSSVSSKSDDRPSSISKGTSSQWLNSASQTVTALISRVR